MPTHARRLRRSVRLSLSYDDRTAYGSAISGGCDERIRRACGHVSDLRSRRGMGAVVASSAELLRESMSPSRLGGWYRRPGQLREECLYPDPRLVRPGLLRVEDGASARRAEIPLEPGLVVDLASWAGELSRGGESPRDRRVQAIWSTLEAMGALEPVEREPALAGEGEITFIGHATVAFDSGQGRLVVDPFLLPWSPSYPANYQPLAMSELGPLDAALITHSHPDHFDLGSLLALGADTTIVVPLVERESLLAVDMAARLRELGFREVRTLRWFETMDLAGFRITALPFYGEQPTTGERHHPEVRNMGNLYLVETAGRRHVLTVDAGKDGQGDVTALAARMGAAGPVDTVFGTHRGFAVYPVQYLYSSVARYLLFVPPSEWTARQAIMNGPHDLLDVAERWGARWAIPYACGGAPWYWTIGLGPTLDAPKDDEQLMDGPPELVVSAARARSGTRAVPLASPVSVPVVRPGSILRFPSDGPEPRCEVVSRDPHAWPYG